MIKKRNSDDKVTDLESFIKKAKKIHGDKYDYSKCVYKNNHTKMTIICPIHGEFLQDSSHHLSGEECPKCKGKRIRESKAMGKEEFVKRANEHYNNKFDYSKAIYVNNNTPLTIICPIHGEFKEKPGKHLIGKFGCPKCRYESLSETRRMDAMEFIDRANIVHNGKYDYSKSIYNGYENKLTITCPIHGDFEQTPDNHLHGAGCPRCGSMISKNEDSLYDFITKELGITKVFRRDRIILSPYEIDIYLPDYKIGIEYDGIWWHCEKYGKNSEYHLDKTKKCISMGIRLIHIFEDEFTYSHEIVLNKLRHILKKDKEKQRIPARKCTVYEINVNDARTFLNKYHIQGFVNSTVYLGCFFKDKLISVMTFKKTSNEKYELNRFSSDYDYICQGTGGKILSYFLKKYNPHYLFTFGDLRWIDTENNIYKTLGFVKEKVIRPSYTYVMSGTFKRKHKFNFRKKILSKKYGFPISMTESEMTEKLGYYKIYDCGLIKYSYPLK
jgi:very-short-patch-repair endonuclease/Zn finger protein HypA/HybF involved in hydrogenase expression